MLGYVSSERLTCLLLELADVSLKTALALTKDELQRGTRTIRDIVAYLKCVAEQIASGMVMFLKLNPFIAPFDFPLIVFTELIS